MKGIIWIFTLFTIALFISFSFFHPGTLQSDDLTLFNPVYMFLETGSMTYPVHGWFETMVVHPPVHYLEIALLMKLGFNSFFAYSTSVFVFILLFLFIVHRSPFSPLIQLGLILSLLTLTLYDISSIRPDTTIAVAWMSGLVLLESARTMNWERKRLFFGTLILTYASGLHYYAAPAFLGALVYAIWVIRDLGWKPAASKLYYIIGGGAVFGIPYLLFFFAGNFNDILTAAYMNQGEGGIIEAIRRHSEIYQIFEDRRGVIQEDVSPLSFLLQPWWTYRIPVFLLASIIFLFIKPLRGLALSTLPMTLFIFLFSRGKSEGYFLPEFMIYIAAAVIVLAFIFSQLLRLFVGMKWRRVIYVVLSILFMSILLIDPRSDDYFGSNDKSHEMHTARLCNRVILGKGSLVGGRMSAWYISGADYWYDLSADLLSTQQVSPKEAKLLLEPFDAIAGTRHMSDLSGNNRTILSWYTSGLLKIKGFYLSNNLSLESELSTLLFSTHKPDSVLGFGKYDERILHRFESDPQGTMMFLTFVIPFMYDQNFERFYPLVRHCLFANFMLMPPNPGTNGLDQQLIIMLLPASVYEQNKDLLTNTHVVDWIRMNQYFTSSEELEKQSQEETTIQFYQTMSDAVGKARRK